MHSVTLSEGCSPLGESQRPKGNPEHLLCTNEPIRDQITS